jgi:hypothetical protein
VQGQELHVCGLLIILPDVVGNGGIHMPLQASVVGNPPSRHGVEMDHLALFPPIAAALPGKHGAFVDSLLRGPPRFREAPIATKYARPCEFGQPQIQRRENEPLVPEDVAALRLPVQSARWDAGLEVGT